MNSTEKSGSYPVFEPNQVLSETQLNNVFNYLDEQNRLTRANLIGIGIVCGFKVSLSHNDTRVHLTKGVGVTSQGYLITEPEDLTFAYYRKYELPTEIDYPPFRDDTPEKKQYPMWELFKASVADETMTSLDQSTLPENKKLTLDNKVLVLFLELEKEDLHNCLPANCDDKGLDINATVRPLLMEKSTLDLILAQEKTESSQLTGYDIETIIEEQLALPDLRLPRYDVPATEPSVSKEVLEAFLNIFQKSNIVTALGAALSGAYQAFEPLLVKKFASNPFVNFSGQFGFLENSLQSEKQALFLQYYYDFFSDLLLAYDEFRWKGAEFFCAGCPPDGYFPRHLMAGALKPGLIGEYKKYRHPFLESPALNHCNGESKELISLFQRITRMIDTFSGEPVLYPSPLQAEIDHEIRITPDKLGDFSLSEKSIPYYYDVTSNPFLQKFWSLEKKHRKRINQNLGYHSFQFNPPPPDFVLDPLEYDFEPWNFLRIEGHLGKNYQDALETLLYQKEKYRLPVRIIALQASAFTEDIQVDFTEDIAFFQDLETLYDTLRKEILATLCETLKHIYDIPMENVQLSGGVPGALLLQEYAPGYEYSQNSVGAWYENNRFGIEEKPYVDIEPEFTQNSWKALIDNIYGTGARPDFKYNIHIMFIYYLIQLAEVMPESLDVLSLEDFENRHGDLMMIVQYMRGLLASGSWGEILPFMINIAAYLKNNQLITQEQFFQFQQKFTKMEADLGKVVIGMAPGAGEVDPVQVEIDQLKNEVSELKKEIDQCKTDCDEYKKEFEEYKIFEDLIDQLDETLYSCKLEPMKSLVEEWERRIKELKKKKLLGNFLQHHPGIQHKAGVPLGGTFILAYHRSDILASGPAVASWAEGRLDLFIRDENNLLKHKWYNGKWSGWETFDQEITSNPAAVSWSNKRIDVFARGKENELLHKFYDKKWSDWKPLGGELASGPAVCSWDEGRLDVFVRGTDHALWHKWFSQGKWSGWESLGGSLASDPAVVSWSPGRIDVFVRGIDNALWHKWYSKGWSGWESLGGALSSGPAVSSWAPGRLDVFVKGTDNALWHKWYSKGWSGWESLGGVLTSNPAAVSWSSGRIDVFARGTNGELWHKWYQPGWVPGAKASKKVSKSQWKPWEPLGGSLTSDSGLSLHSSSGLNDDIITKALNGLDDGAVIADFYLPYICCSDGPSVDFVLPKPMPSFTIKFECTNSEGLAKTDLKVRGGDAPYLMKINEETYTDFTPTLNLPAGDYVITVMDSAGTESIEQKFTIPDQLVVSEPEFINNFDDQTYRIRFTINGGADPYTVNSAQINGSDYLSGPIPSGEKVLLVIKDKKGCAIKKELSHTVPERPAFEVEAGCANSSGAAEITIKPVAGEEPFTYSINGSSYQALQNPVSVQGDLQTAVDVTITIKDSLQIESLPVTQTIYPPLAIGPETYHERTTNLENPAYRVKFEVTGGASPYTSEQGTFAGNIFTSAPVKSGTALKVAIQDKAGCTIEKEFPPYTVCTLPCDGIALRRDYRFSLPVPSKTVTLKQVTFTYTDPITGRVKNLSQKAREVFETARKTGNFNRDFVSKMNEMLVAQIGANTLIFSCKTLDMAFTENTPIRGIQDSLGIWSIDYFQCADFNFEVKWTDAPLSEPVPVEPAPVEPVPVEPGTVRLPRENLLSDFNVRRRVSSTVTNLAVNLVPVTLAPILFTKMVAVKKSGSSILLATDSPITIAAYDGVRIDKCVKPPVETRLCTSIPRIALSIQIDASKNLTGVATAVVTSRIPRGVTYFWEVFGSKQRYGAGKTATFTFNKGGSYRFILTLFTSQGCIKRVVQTQKIENLI